MQGALLFVWASCAAAASEWPEPYFLPAKYPNGNVTWRSSPYPNTAVASIWEGTEGDVEIMRLSYQAEGEDFPKILSGGLALGIKLGKDDDPSTPIYLQATEAGDYEAGEGRLIIRLSAPSGTTTATGTVNLDLVNVNDNAPTISSPSTCLVKEEYTGSTDCKFVVTDPDGGACYARMKVKDDKFSFSLSEEPTANCFSATFILNVESKLDYETFRLHTLEITAEDDGQIGPNDFLAGGFYQERVIQFVVDVEDIPDEPPRWEVIVPSVTVNEKTKWSEQMRAIDGDYGLNWPIVYKLVFPDDGFEYSKYFEISKESGVLTVHPINRDELQREIYKFIIVATEVPPASFPNFEAMSTSNDIVVMLNDLNDNIPAVEPAIIEYIEFPEEQPFTDRNFTVTDPDLADHGTFHLKLKDSKWSSNFLLIPSSGYQEVGLTISALDPSLLDYEDPDWRVIDLTIIAEEDADETHTATAVLRIELLDLIDEPPEFEKEEYSVSIPENQPEGFLVEHTIAHDRDENDVVKYSITNTLMEIDEDGRITTKSSNAFDYERQTEISFQVVATDTGNLKDFCQVNIKIIDINDEQPTLIMPPITMKVPEHSEVNTPVSHDISATDPDTEADLRFEIVWEDSAAYTQGVEIQDKTLYQTSVKLAETKVVDGVWTTHLVIADSDEFDWEEFDTLRIQISVIDDGTHPDYLHNSKSSAILTVNVEDINDNPPVFMDKKDRDNFTVTENTQENRVIGSLIATDADSPEHSRITYTIEPSFPPELVNDERGPRLAINPETGVLSTTKVAIDCDEWKTVEFKYVVTASDGKHHTPEEITLYIEDENDILPDVTEPEDKKNTTSFPEHTSGRQLLSCITGVDDDYSENFHTITYYIAEDADDFFEMESPCKSTEECCLWAKDGTNMDREIKETHVIEVLSRDNFEDGVLWKSNSGPTVTITLILEDINDHKPEFQNTGELKEDVETVPYEDYKFFDVDVTDKDIGLNGEIECEEIPEVTSVPERPEGLFTIKTEKTKDGGYKCAVHATKSFRGYWGLYSLKLKANDKGEGNNPGEGDYMLRVKNENLNDPTIVYPNNGDTIRLRRAQDPDNGKPLITFGGTEMEYFRTDDLDDPDTPNGKVELKLTDPDDVFGVVQVPSKPNTFRLVLLVPVVPEEKKQFHLTLQANDMPGSNENGQRFSSPVEIDVYVIETDSTPAFSERETTVSFHENSTGLTESSVLPEARNFDEELAEEEYRRTIYYYIIGGDEEYFVLDKLTRVLTLRKMLDYEDITEHKIVVGATHEETQPSSNEFYGSAILQVTVEVIDINDMPPVFVQEIFPGAFSVDHDPGTHIMDLKAEDLDTNSILTYLMIPGTIEAHSDSLKQFENDNAFLVDSATGAISLNFSPGGRQLDGYFSFDVKVHDQAGDEPGHRHMATVNVFVVSGAHQMIFYFFNPVNVVEAKQDDMATEFSRILGYTCTVEKVREATSEGDIQTSEVLSYFLDETDKAPVPREKIEEEFLKTNTNSMLYAAMQDLSLSFRGYNTATSAKEPRSYMTIVLAAVCAVLAVLVVVFSLAFVVRTRTLNQRLEKLTSKKFGSQDSGLNRDSMAVPGTNVHALEGSNPVWNHDIDRSFDNMSQSSGDSDLIGIEDSPQFNDEDGGVSNRAYEPGASKHQFEETFVPNDLPPRYDELPRRTSINPLAAAAAAESGGFEALSDPEPLALEDVGFPRKISLNPLAAGFDTELDSVEVDVQSHEDVKDAPGDSNFSFQQPTEPSTEL